MTTLEQQRRAIGVAKEAARRGLGISNEAARRGIGTSMEAQRRGTNVIDDLNSVVVPVQQGRLLPSLESRGARPAARGVADYKAPTSTGGGIASPLVEQNTNLREYFPEEYLKSTDGLMWSRARPLKKIVMQDANGDSVVMEFKNGLSE
ncbi:hypothetical protein ACNFH8_23955 [Pseudomonas sp. NY15436]|uniref:hypothetical protein n=1 Tax=Pseudomonas sp. NY15436 TaxID=3400359 RepID=UPI003A86A5EB